MPYTIHHLPQFTDERVFVSVFTGIQPDVLNSVKDRLVKGDFDGALINTAHIVSTEQLYFAVYRAMTNHKNGTMKAKTLNAEIIYNLSPVNNIMEAFKKFGIDDKIPNVIIVKILTKDDDPEKINDDLTTQLKAESNPLLSDDVLFGLADIPKTKKVYKIQTEGGQGELTRLIIGSCVVRGV